MSFKEKYQNKINLLFPNENLKIVEDSGIAKGPCKIMCLDCLETYSFAKLTQLNKSKKYVCKKCGKQKYIQQKFEQRIKDKYPNEPFELINFTNTQQPCSIKCLKCGTIFNFKVATSICSRVHLCNSCFKYRNDELKQTQQKFKDFIAKSNQWILISELTNMRSQELVECKCKYCGKINQKTMYDYLKGIGCTCSRWNTEEKLLEVMEGQYKPLEPIAHCRKRIMVEHICGFKYTINPSSFINGYNRCPKCSKHHSKGENIIRQWLINNNIPFETEYPIILQNHNLRFDFYLPLSKQYIEFQGEQHFKAVDFFGGEEKYQQRLIYDKLKREYCKDALIEISYKDIEKINDILSFKVQRLS